MCPDRIVREAKRRDKVIDRLCRLPKQQHYSPACAFKEAIVVFSLAHLFYFSPFYQELLVISDKSNKTLTY